jgi:hypothetical protein
MKELKLIGTTWAMYAKFLLPLKRWLFGNHNL